MLPSQARSSIRWSKSIAHPSVTALSPSRFSSIFRFGSVNAKCSVWPASWKSAYQSSGPPCGWITSITLPGISIGAQNARGLFVGRSSTSRWTFCCASRSIPRFASVPRRAGSIRSAGNAWSQLEPRNKRRGRVARASASPMPTRSRKTPVHRVLVQALGRVEEGAALGGQPFEVVLEAVAVEVEVGGRAELGDRALGRVDGVEVERVQVLLGQLVPDLLEPRARLAVGGVGDRRRQHPVANGLALVLDLELCLAAPRSSRRSRASLARGSPRSRSGRAPGFRRAPSRRGADRLEVGQVGVALVDRLELELRLQAGVVEVVLLVELRDEAVGAGAIAVELTVTERALAHAA